MKEEFLNRRRPLSYRILRLNLVFNPIAPVDVEKYELKAKNASLP